MLLSTNRLQGLLVPRNDLHVAVFWKLLWNSLNSFFEREGVRVVRIVWKHSFAWPSSHAGGTLLSSCANLPCARLLPLSACQVCFYVCCLNPIIHDLQHSLHLFSVPQTQVTDAFLHLPLSQHFLFSTFINFQTVLEESRLKVMKLPICS